MDVRAFEHGLRGARLPQPKRLLDCLTLLYVAAYAEGLGHPTLQTALEIGLDRGRFERLCYRLLPRLPYSGPLPPSTLFDCALVSFASETHVAQRRVKDVLGRMALAR